MKTVVLPTIICLLVAFLIPVSEAQIKPVRLKVNKVVRKKRETVSLDISGAHRQKQVTKKVYYTIEIANARTRPVSNGRVEWAILVETTRAKAHPGFGTSWSGGGQQVIEGDHSFNLGLGQKISFDTDILEFSNVSRGYARTGYRVLHGGKVLGFYVDVFVEGVLVASEMQPLDTQRRINQLKQDKQKAQEPAQNGGQKRHCF